MAKTVYNPDRSVLEFLHGAKPYKLKAEGYTKLDDVVADHAVDVLGKWGVVIDEGPESIAAADKVHADSVRKFYEDVLVDHARKNSHLFAAGLPVQESDLVKDAKAYFDKLSNPPPAEKPSIASRIKSALK